MDLASMERGSLLGPGTDVIAAAFLSDGRMLTAGRDHTMLVHSGDGRLLLLSGGDDGVVQAWPTNVVDLLATARDRVVRVVPSVAPR